MPNAPAAPHAKKNAAGTPEQPALPAQWLYGLYAFSPASGLFSHRRLARSSPARLDPSTGGPGLRDFAVRIGRIRLLQPARPSHPAPNVRDDREPPLLKEAGRAENTADLVF
jgi:hypothetical protein